MEAVVKIENCDDEEEFQCIPMEETQLSEVGLTPDSTLTARNSKRSYNTMMDGTLTVTEDKASDPLPSEEQPTPPKKTNTNDSKVLDPTHIIYTPPFFKIIHELGPEKDIYIVRCYTCGRLMRSSAKHPPLVITRHLKSFHQEIAKLYEKYKLNHMRQSSNTNAETNNSNRSIVEVNTNCSKVNDNVLGAIPGTVRNENHTENFIIEIVDDDFNGNDHTVNNETTSNQNISILDDENDACVSILDNDRNAASVSILDNEENAANAFILDNDKNAAELSATTSEKLGDIINQRLQKFVKETGFKELNNKVDELLKSNTKNDSSSHSIIKELKSEVNNLKNECKSLRLAVLQAQASKRQFQNELQKMENYLQQRKLLIKNIKIFNRQQPQKDVEKLFKDSLNLDNITIVKCSIIPCSKKSNSSKTSTDTESISVELLQVEDCKLVLRQMHKLKDTGIFIEPELTPSQRKRRNKLMLLRKELLTHKSDLKVLVRNTTLVVNGKKFYWDDIEGLYHNEAEAIQTTGVEYLNSLTGLDLKQFIGFLLKYQMNVRKN